MVKIRKKIDLEVDMKLLEMGVPQDRKKKETIVEEDDRFAVTVSEDNIPKKITIKHALTILIQQMKLNGLRKRTIEDYGNQFKRFTQMVKIQYLNEINTDKIYEYLSLLGDIKDISKLNRLKTIKAVLGRCYENGWIKDRYWDAIKIKVDKTVKKPSEESELRTLLSLLDKTTYSGFRDSVAILLIYKTGIRITTLGLLEEKHIDFNEKMLVLTGDIMKSHRVLKLPLDEDISLLLKQLIQINEEIKSEFHEKNTFIFLTSMATPIKNTVSPSNLIAKNLWKYSKRYGLKNVNAHSIRRLYAQNLVKKGANINLVSHALGHSSLETTSRYLYLNEEVVAKNLREFL